jgi:hypothetical protein
MTRNEKIETITTVCAAASPRDLHARNYLRLSHVLAAFRNHKANYTIGPQGFFLNPGSRTSTHVRWDVFKNDLTRQSDECVDFLYARFSKPE